MAVLADLEPDVLALQECQGWSTDGCRTLHEAEQLLGMRGFLSASAHHGCDLGIFVRESAGLRVLEQRHERGNEWWHGVAGLLVEVKGVRQPLQVASCHLAPSSPVRRLEEAEAFALIAERGPLIAAGDWNAFPACRECDPDPDGPVEGKRRRKLDRRPAEALEEAGLTDVGHLMTNGTATVGHETGLYYRADRICTNLPAETIAGYTVITDTDEDSDHRPVVAEFDLAEDPG